MSTPSTRSQLAARALRPALSTGAQRVAVVDLLGVLTHHAEAHPQLLVDGRHWGERGRLLGVGAVPDNRLHVHGEVAPDRAGPASSAVGRADHLAGRDHRFLPSRTLATSGGR